MKSRLSAYLESAKLAKLYYDAAQKLSRKGELQKAVNAMTMGNMYFLAAMNNVASIAFRAKPKGWRK